MMTRQLMLCVCFVGYRRGIVIMIITMLRRLLLKLLWYRDHGGLVCGIILHFFLEPYLVIGCHLFKSFLFIDRQCPPTFTQYFTQIHKFNTGMVAQYLWAHLICEEHVGTTGAFGCRWVLGTTFLVLLRSLVLDQHSTSIMAWWWDVRRNFSIETGLILMRTSLPCCLFFGG